MAKNIITYTNLDVTQFIETFVTDEKKTGHF